MNINDVITKIIEYTKEEMDCYGIADEIAGQILLNVYIQITNDIAQKCAAD